MIHTIISENDIFFEPTTVSENNYINITGGILECTNSFGENRIVRLHSTNPFLYLREDFSPYRIYNKKSGR